MWNATCVVAALAACAGVVRADSVVFTLRTGNGPSDFAPWWLGRNADFFDIQGFGISTRVFETSAPVSFVRASGEFSDGIDQPQTWRIDSWPNPLVGVTYSFTRPESVWFAPLGAPDFAGLYDVTGVRLTIDHASRVPDQELYRWTVAYRFEFLGTPVPGPGATAALAVGGFLLARRRRRSGSVVLRTTRWQR
jgi:hypothetical protein